MALIDRIIGPALGRYFDQLTKGFGTAMTHSGQRIGPESPFELVAIRSAINVLAQDVATLPLYLYRREGRGRTEAKDHPLYNVLRWQPNPRMTAFEFREAKMVALLTWGNFYAYKEMNSTGSVVGLWPLRPDKMTVQLVEGRIIYTYTPSDATAQPKDFEASEILHVKGLSSDGLVGRTPLYDFREKFGEIAAMERFSQSFYGNGMKRSAVLKRPAEIGGQRNPPLSTTALERLTKSIEDESGADKAFKVIILEEGMDFSELSFAPEDAQLLETRRFGVEDACRIYNLPPYKLRINTPGTVSYASVDAQGVDYLVSTLRPWQVRTEQAVMCSCLTPAERESGLFVEHDTRAMLRSDLKSQAEAHRIYREISVLTVNDVLEEMGRNPSPDPRADDLWSATYVQSTGKPTSEPDMPDMPDDPPQDSPVA